MCIYVYTFGAVSYDIFWQAHADRKLSRAAAATAGIEAEQVICV